MIFVIAMIFTIDFGLIKHYLKNKVEEDLKHRCKEIHQTIQTSLNSSIENYLKGITEANLDIVRNYYEKYKNGSITEEEDKNAVQAYCSRQTIGTSGYIAAVENIYERLILALHPYKRYENCSKKTACTAWDSARNGYAEYN